MDIPVFENNESCKDRHVYKKDGKHYAFNGSKRELVEITEDAAKAQQAKILAKAKLAAEAEKALEEKRQKAAKMQESLEWVNGKIKEDENATFDALFTRLVLNAPIDESKIISHDNGAINFSIEYVRDLADKIFFGRVQERIEATPVIEFVKKSSGKMCKEITYFANVTVTYPVSGTVRSVSGAATGSPGMVFSQTGTQSTGSALKTKAMKNAYQELGIAFGRAYNSRESEAEVYDLKIDIAADKKAKSI